VELAFLTLLLKDGTKSIGGGVAINNEGLLETRLSENRCGANGVDESIECGLVFILPVEATALSTVGDERIEWSG
jgi:hypothetical protein